MFSQKVKKVQTADSNGVTTVVYGVLFQFRAENPRTALYLFSRDSVLSSVHGVVIDSLTCHYVVFWKMARNIFFLCYIFSSTSSESSKQRKELRSANSQQHHVF